MNWIKGFFSLALVTLIIVVGVEFGVRLIYFAESNGWLSIPHLKQERETFNIRGFSKLTDDERFATMIPSITWGRPTEWQVVTNPQRLRIDPRNRQLYGDLCTQAFNYLSCNESVLFIGDSVPFGWGVNAEHSLPEIWKEFDKESIVRNGAIPSYSLRQSLHRLRIEFADLKNVRSIYLQIYDPVGQYARLGQSWDENDNWTTQDDVISQRERCKLIKNKYLESNFRSIHFINKLSIIYQGCETGVPENLRKFTEASDSRFVAAVKDDIKRISMISKAMNSKLYIAPLVPSTMSGMNERYRDVINLLNKTIKDSASELNFTYVPINLVLKTVRFY